ncbi:hypothetical protein ACFO3O_21270 [Dokdonia ponticola]|uniref:DUF4367 domain-containing protein n=1 Tax=Dokdonia ponticola TaxID=2041041 RepID=A0ABV9I207_9FLAO
MKNIFILIIVLSAITSSCAQNDNWKILEEKIKRETNICRPCLDKYSNDEIKPLLNILGKDLKTQVFDSLNYNRQISFSFCNNKYKEEGYLDCIYITELKASNESIAMDSYKKLIKIPETTIHYIRPQNWEWIVRGNYIYFLYSNTYKQDSYEFNEIKKIVYEIL